MSILNNSLLLGADLGGYQVARSLRFNSSDSAYLSRTPASAGNRKTWTFSAWIKRSALATAGDAYLFAARSGSPWGAITFGASGTYVDRLQVTFTAGVSEGTYSAQVFRDASAWYHIIVAVDTTQATAADRIKMYVNGTQVTVFANTNYPSQNADTQFNNTIAHYIGASSSANEYFSGYLADIHFIDGQALTPSSFAETNATTGQWVPKAYSGSYGTNGFQLKFADNSNNTATTLGKDTSGNGNNWTPNNLSVTAGAGNDSLVDTPTSYGTDAGAGGEVRGNYCTFNPLKVLGSTATFSNGNLDISTTSVGFPAGVGTVGVSSGKWYWEITPTGGSGRPQIGVCKDSDTPNGEGIGGSAGAYIYESDQYKGNNGTFTSYGASFATNDVIGVALDLDAGTITFYKNGSSQGQAFSGLSGTFFPVVGEPDNAASITASANFGQRPFAYTAPSGFKALCTANLPAPVVTKPSTVMDVKLYTGNGSTQTISGLDMSPDLVWIKSRSSAASHRLLDQVRGATKLLFSNATDAEDTDANTLTQFNSDGFNLGSSTGVNGTSTTYVAWCWDAGSSTVTNTQGSISSQVRANASAGFSIVTYTGNATTGATVGHGLGVAPGFVIIKDRGAAFDWRVWLTTFGTGNALSLNSTAATSSNSPVMQAAPSSTVMSLLGSGYSVNNSGNTYVAYCFAPVAGYSSFGSYTGNGSADGPFVYTGFRPRWVMIKRSDNAGSWGILDTARNTFNVQDKLLWANLSDAEGTYTICDALSNGFKLRESTNGFNASSATYVWAAFAESPFQYARAR
jgi:hypothetical protein